MKVATMILLFVLVRVIPSVLMYNTVVSGRPDCQKMQVLHDIEGLKFEHLIFKSITTQHVQQLYPTW